MSDNPFKIIEPRETVPENLKDEVMGSVRSVVLILRFVQLFVGDFSSTLMRMYRTGSADRKNHHKDKK
jgi:hypothetical protein